MLNRLFHIPLLLLLGLLSCTKEAVTLPDDSIPKPGAVRIPDPEFEQRLVDLKIDSDQTVNGWVNKKDVENIDTLKIKSMENGRWTLIKSLKGIEYFTNLVYLDCMGNDIDSLDVSQNKKLKWLNCSGYRLDVGGILKRQIRYLNISENPELEELYIGLTRWMRPDVSGQTKLRKAEFGGYLVKIDLSKNTALTSLQIVDGYWVDHLDLTHNTSLKELTFTDTGISSIDLSKNDLLEKISCPRNKLLSLDLKHNGLLKELDCSYNQLDELNLKGLKNLTKLDCSYNYNDKGRLINHLDLSDNFQLKELLMNGSPITSLDLSKNELIDRLSMHSSEVRSLNLDKLINLRILLISSSKISNLNLKNNKKLESLDCSSTPLEVIDLSNNENLTRFYCPSNPNLKMIDIRKCKKLDLFVSGASPNLKTICVSSLTEAAAKPNWSKDPSTEFKVCD